MLGPDALAWRDRHYGQSSCPQGRRRARENRGNRRNAAAPTPLFSRSQSDRAVLRKTQSSPAQVRRALHPRPRGPNRNKAPDLHSRRVQQLLHTRRIWAKMRGIRSSCVSLRPKCLGPRYFRTNSFGWSWDSPSNFSDIVVRSDVQRVEAFLTREFRKGKRFVWSIYKVTHVSVYKVTRVSLQSDTLY